MPKRKDSASSAFIGIISYIPGLFFLVYSVSAGNTPSLPLLLLSCYFIYLGSLAMYDPAEKSGDSLMKITFFLFFVLYIIIIVNYTLFDGFFGRHAKLPFPIDPAALRTHFSEHSNLVPFFTVGSLIKGFRAGNVSPRFFITNICGNLAAFAPFAFFMPLLFKRMKRFLNFFIFISAAVILIEALQLLLLTGSADIDDFLLNVAGACILYALLHIKPVKKMIFNITKLHI